MKLTLVLLSVTTLLLIEATAKPGTRIIGGQTAEPNQFPYAAAIRVQTKNETHFCSGVLTDVRFVLTSGSCIYNGVHFTIQLGSITLTTPDENRVIAESSEFYVHPEFDPMTLHADVGLIKFNASLSDSIKSVGWLIDDTKPGTNFTILGWGQTTDASEDLSEYLQYAQVTSISNEDCRSYYGDQIIDGMICVVGNSNEGACSGDNGGPLIQYFAGAYSLVGVASFISGNGCESTEPSGYTSITPYYIWMWNIILEG